MPALDEAEQPSAPEQAMAVAVELRQKLVNSEFREGDTKILDYSGEPDPLKFGVGVAAAEALSLDPQNQLIPLFRPDGRQNGVNMREYTAAVAQARRIESPDGNNLRVVDYQNHEPSQPTFQRIYIIKEDVWQTEAQKCRTAFNSAYNETFEEYKPRDEIAILKPEAFAVSPSRPTLIIGPRADEYDAVTTAINSGDYNVVHLKGAPGELDGWDGAVMINTFGQRDGSFHGRAFSISCDSEIVAQKRQTGEWASRPTSTKVGVRNTPAIGIQKDLFTSDYEHQQLLIHTPKGDFQIYPDNIKIQAPLITFGIRKAAPAGS